MAQYQKSFTSNTASTTVDLSQLSGFNSNSIYDISTFNVEVVGNTAEVTLTVFGPFANSIEQTPDGESTFAIGGGSLILRDVALGKMKFVRTGTAAYTINITRSTD